MESLIILIILALFSSLGNGKKRKSRSQNGQQMQNMQDLAQQTQQAPDDVCTYPMPQSSSNRHRRTDSRQARSQKPECGYCTGDIVVEASLPHHAVPVELKEPDKPCVDIAALQKHWELSDLQNALLWQEILDKPLAVRRRGLR